MSDVGCLILISLKPKPVFLVLIFLLLNIDFSVLMTWLSAFDIAPVLLSFKIKPCLQINTPTFAS